MGFLEEYQQWASDCCDAPPIFHSFSGISALASVMARRIRFPFGAGNVYPNIWVLLVGSSGSRKSQSMKLMRLLLQDAKVPVFPNEFSNEKLVALIAERKSGTFCISEFSQFMGGTRKSYNEGTLGFLTDIYDVPEEYTRSTKAGDLTLIRPTVVMIACSTPDFMGANEEEWASGFGPRFLVIQGERTSHIPLPPPPDPERRKRLSRFLHNASQVGAVCHLADEKHFVEWASAFDEKMRQKSLMEQSIGVRVENYVLKLSMLIQISMTEELFQGVPSALRVDAPAFPGQQVKRMKISRAAVRKAIEVAERVMLRQYDAVRKSSIVGGKGASNRKQQAAFLEAMRTLGGSAGAAVLHKRIAKHLGWHGGVIKSTVEDLMGQEDLMRLKVPDPKTNRNSQAYCLVLAEKT